MVDGVNGGNYKPLKLKGTGKSIDLNKLEGLRVTEKNKSIFSGKALNIDINGDGKIDENDTFDTNGDGIINGDEVGKMQQFLNKLGGRDHKTTAKDFHTTDANNQTNFEALESLADQQAAAVDNKIYEEKTGNTTTVFHADGSKTETIKEEDKITDITYPKGSNKPSSKQERTPEKDTYSEYTYDGDTTTTRKYDRTNNSGKLESITVSGKKEPAPELFELPEGDATTEATYNSQEDFDAGKPAAKTFDYGNTKVTVSYKYNDDGTITATIPTREDGDKVVTYKQNADGTTEAVETKPQEAAPETKPQEETQPQQDTQPAAYEVKRGDNLWKIAKNHLGEGATATEIANLVNDMIEANPQIKNPNLIYPGDQITIPTGEKPEAAQSTPQAQPTQPTQPTQPATPAPAPAQNEVKYDLNKDSVYNGIKDEGKKAQYKEFMDNWQEGNKVSFGEGDNKKDYTQTTLPDGTRVFSRGICQYKINEDCKPGDMLWKDNVTVKYDNKEYTQKTTEGKYHYLESDGLNYAIDSENKPWRLEEGNTITIKSGDTYTVKKDKDGELYLEGVDGTKYEITPDQGRGEVIIEESIPGISD